MAKPEIGSEQQGGLSEHQIKITGELGALALMHIEESGGKLSLLPADASQLEHHLEGTPVESQFIKATATLADSRFPELQKATSRAIEASPHTLPMVREILRNGDNLVVFTNHGELTDIALAFAAVTDHLAHNGFEDVFQNYRRGIMISQIVSRIGINLEASEAPVEAARALTMLCHDVWKTYPNTDSISKVRGFWRDETQSHNRKVKNGIRHKFEDGGYILAMAPSGRKDRQTPEEPGTVLLHPLKSGTVDILTQPQTYLLGLGVWMQDGEPIVDFIDYEPGNSSVRGIPTRVKNMDEANTQMVALTSTLNRIVPERNFIYLPSTEETKKTVKRIASHIRPH